MSDQRPLIECLSYEPRELQFGTSGRRGEVRHLTQLEVYINALAELEYLQSLSPESGGIRRGDRFYVGHDLRPSSTACVDEFEGRGEVLQAVVQAVMDAVMEPVNLGPLPTPAVMSFAVQRGCGSIMVTGSHIPFDRNGYKTSSSRGELRKEDEPPIMAIVRRIRGRVYQGPFTDSPFDSHGMFKSGHRQPPAVEPMGAAAYLDRYLSFFPPGGLAGARLLAYQHSAVGRDLLVQLFQGLGAEVVPFGRSETFVPIDTENIDEATLAHIGNLARDERGPFDAIVSTDGDSDRPLLLAYEPGADRSRLRFFGGDLLGMVTASFLGADAVVVPISCNDGIERGALQDVLEPRTKIGSPHVIAGMERALTSGKRKVCGWEANGGFLLGSDVECEGRMLRALPTRDAFLPLASALLATQEGGVSLSELFDSLPKRFSRAALLKNTPRERSLAIVQKLSDPEAGPAILRSVFTADRGFGRIVRTDNLDGFRIWFDDGDIAHVRPSGNADELRIYAVADTQERADEIARLGVAEPDGILKRLGGLAT